MFIRKQSHDYYDRHGSQCSGKGDYLILFSWNGFKASEEIQAQCEDCQWRKLSLSSAREHGTYRFYDHARSEAIMNAYQCCSRHRDYNVPGPRYSNGKDVLYAAVRKVSMSQCGQFMMGRLRIGGKTLVVSGEVGSDGLPDNLQDVPMAWRDKLTVVPEDVATAYWISNGWNEVGQARDVLAAWAKTLF